MILFNNIELVPRGKRLAGLHKASLKVLGKTKAWEKIFGIGRKIEILNSLGESYIDRESAEKTFSMFNAKSIEDAKVYIEKLYTLRDTLIKEVEAEPSKDFTEDFSMMMGYFFAIKFIFELLYTKSNPDEQKIMEHWRNDPNILTPIGMYYKLHPEIAEETLKEWSWVYSDNELHLEEKIISFSQKPEISNVREIKGNVAYPGFVTGKVRVILTLEDKELMQEGEIIVAPMTTVDFLPIMKIASAFVTNEGGITSHAAIVARELKKPCITGTRIATEVLKTGDLVEVDADKGIIRIINKL